MGAFEDYKKTICTYCVNCKTDLCEIKRTVDGTVRCVYYERVKKERRENE